MVVSVITTHAASAIRKKNLVAVRLERMARADICALLHSVAATRWFQCRFFMRWLDCDTNSITERQQRRCKASDTRTGRSKGHRGGRVTVEGRHAFARIRCRRWALRQSTDSGHRRGADVARCDFCTRLREHPSKKENNRGCFELLFTT